MVAPRSPIATLDDGLPVYFDEKANRHYVRPRRCNVLLSAYLANKHIREVLPGEVVHHIDGNTLNDELSNLQILSRAEHIRVHKPALGYQFTDAQRKKQSDRKKGKPSPLKGRKCGPMPEETRKKISEAHKGRKVTWGAKVSVGKTKASKAALLAYITARPKCDLQQIKRDFCLKSNSPIIRHGGLFRLKQECFPGQCVKRLRFQKLDFRTADEIRKRNSSGESQRSLARVFGVSQSTIVKIIKGETYAESNYIR